MAVVLRRVAATNRAANQNETALSGQAQKRTREEETDQKLAEDKLTSGDMEPLTGPKPPKSYRNQDFLNSNDARMIRVMCEFEEPRARLEKHDVKNIVMFFGSARAKPRKQYEQAVRQAEAKVAASPEDPVANAALQRLKKQAFLIPMFDAVRDLAKMLTEWSETRKNQGLPTYCVGTGAGPGMMEAANEGASLAQGPSVGFGISLPFEDGLNPYVTPELGFEFHYFFTRKFWMCYKCMALVVAPGGLGTCDELFELITLMQTGKIKRKLPVILIGKEFWHACINWQAFVDYGMISESDASQLVFADSAEEAFPHLIKGLEKLEVEASPNSRPSNPTPKALPLMKLDCGK